MAASKVLTTTVSSDEVNYLVFRYLQESGYVHSAFTFGYESHVSKSRVDGSQIPPGALLSFVQRGVNFVEIEESISNSGENGLSSSPALDGVTSLLDVHRYLSSENVKKGRPDRLASLHRADGAQPSVSNTAGGVSQAEGGADIGENANGPSTGNNAQTSAEAQEPMDVDNKDLPAASPNASESNNGEANHASGILEIPSSDVMVLRGHSSEVFVCAWNPRSSVLASGSGDSTARIWPIPTTSQTTQGSSSSAVAQPLVLEHLFSSESANDGIGERPRKANDVTTMDWNNTGTLLATGSYDGCARIWQDNGDLKHTLRLHKGPLFSLKWNSAGNYLLSGSVDKTTAIWDAETGSCVRQFKVHNAPTLDVDWKDDTSFASCSTDRMIYLCSVDEPNPLRAFEGHRDEINCLRFDPSGSLLASCSDDATAKVWSVTSSAPVYDLREHTKEVYTMRWSPGSSRRLMLATASFDSTVKLWDINNGRCVESFENHRDPVYSVDFSPNGEFLASGSFDRQLCIWSVKDAKLIKTYRGQGGIFEVTWNRAGDKIAACFANNTVAVFDFRML